MANEFWKKFKFYERAKIPLCDGHLGSLYFGAVAHRFSEYSFAFVWVSHPFLLVTGQGMKFLGSRISICSLELLKMVLLLYSPSRSSWVSVASSLTRLAFSSSFLLPVSWYLLLPSTALLWVCFLSGDQILCSNDCSILNLHQQWAPAVCSLTRPWCVIFFRSHCDIVQWHLTVVFVSLVTNNGEYLSCASLMIPQKTYASF